MGRQPNRDGEREQGCFDDRPVQQQPVREEDPAREHGRHVDEEQRETSQAPLEGGLRLALPQLEGDPSEHGAGTGLDNDATSRAAADDRAHVRDGSEVEFDEVCTRFDVRTLRLRHRLASEDGFVALHFLGVEQPQVCRHEVTCPQQHDVTRHQVDDVDPHLNFVPHHESAMANRVVQGLDDAG